MKTGCEFQKFKGGKKKKNPTKFSRNKNEEDAENIFSTLFYTEGPDLIKGDLVRTPCRISQTINLFTKQKEDSTKKGEKGGGGTPLEIR